MIKLLAKIQFFERQIFDYAFRKKYVDKEAHAKLTLWFQLPDGTKYFKFPRGFAHGFVTLSKDAIFQYKVDNYYAPNHEAGIKFDDKVLNIDWKMKARLMVSQKDKMLPIFNQYLIPYRQI